MPWDQEFVTRSLAGRTVLYFDSVDSTMREVERHPAGTLVVAGEQTAGIGRHGHSWHSEADGGLYFSVILPVTPLLTLALGIATVEALASATRLVCDLRWPNDLMLHGRKLAGILVQSTAAGAVAGIGINVAQRRFPEDISALATSLYLETGLEFRREDIFVELVRGLDVWRNAPPARIREEFAKRSSYVSGKRVIAPIGGRETECTTAGLTPEGFLQVVTASGRREAIVAGGVRPL